MTANTLAALLTARAADDRPGLLFEDAAWSWREHVAACRSAGTWLTRRGTGSHVGVLSDNVPGMLVLVGGAALAGHVVVALNPTRPAAELSRDARATDAGLVLFDEPYADLARALDVPALPLSAIAAAPAEPPETGEPGPGDLLMLIFTSGTSGRPRAVRVTQRKLAVPGTSLAAMLTPQDVVYCAMPLFHSGALMAAYAPAVASGAALVLRRRFSASGLLPDVRRYGCTYLHYVGKALSYVLATPERPDDADNPLRIAFGNEGSAVATRRFGERFGCHVIDAFGSTETAVSISPDPSGPPGSLGRLPEGVAVLNPFTGEPCPPGRVEDGRLLNPDEAVGELVNTAGLGLFEGYYNDPEADAERVRDGAFWSGDLAWRDAEGHVFFAGRGTERLRVDGENLSAAPVEAALREFPGVVEAAVYPVPDAAAGDQVMAALVLEGGFDPDAFAAFLAARRDLGAKSLPRYVRLSEGLPQTPSHKVLKRVLAREGWRTRDPVWWRTPAGLRPLTEADVKGIEEEFVRHGRQHLLET
ncbi:AMP-binding protein [Actinomadura sp. ATCC 31491]|uniref:AMP-binding protein n=1 Tax=Actinomadura luzonensis TaxID=2805427 RepID=A0ABT0FKT3_9ACTN|nr:AMP-binding protein [Actinomadura luzonensis]MCK2212864.1 AMP-binding protein [Actinomadura luzonensis]